MARYSESASGERHRKMGAVTALVVAGAALLLGWAAVEVACKPCLQQGRDALNRSLDPDYDPDNDLGGNYSQASTNEEAENQEEVKKPPKEV